MVRGSTKVASRVNGGGGGGVCFCNGTATTEIYTRSLHDALPIWAFAPVLIVVGLWLAMSARGQGAGAGAAPRSSAMSEKDARSILGVGPEATREEIQAAYTRLMRRAHPDAGGSAGLASQLNAARDRLIRR